MQKIKNFVKFDNFTVNLNKITDLRAYGILYKAILLFASFWHKRKQGFGDSVPKIYFYQ